MAFHPWGKTGSERRMSAFFAMKTRLRDNGKRDPSVQAIHGEVTAVHCEDLPDAFSLRNSD